MMRLRSIYFAAALALAGLAGFANAAGNNTANTTQSIASIQVLTESFLRNHYDSLTQGQLQDAHISVNSLDPRLQLSACDKPLTPSLQSKGSQGGRVTVKVRCTGIKPWAVYVTAKVTIMAPVAVATRSLPRGTLLHPEDISLEARNIASLPRGYVTDVSRVEQLQVKRPLRPGDLIRLPNLAQPTAIKRGDEVAIEASSGAISVVMPGEALSDGRIGQQISIRNRKSSRIIKARVVAPGRVQVMI